MDGKATIIVHQFGRGPFCPSFTPFGVKLETYLRMANIKYTNVNDCKVSKKGKMPWIEFNGQEVNDSSFIIEFLNEKYKQDFNSHLSSTDKAVARAFQKMAEENLYWCMVLHRCVYDKQDWVCKALGVNRFFAWLLSRHIKSRAEQQGIGRHSFEEMVHIEEGDLKAMSEFLDTKKFFFGDKPCETDCALFGQLSQFRWQLPNTKGEHFVNEKYPNLREYCDRMKEMFWPDWDKCCSGDSEEKKEKY
ncbi:hypothetical protein SNE40_006264 [Patella caerulea]|uniref:Failed axon connections protein n=1 Tax=Patella caerulea TaxID=87958 RepID=A0AAN8K0M5_PATCE